MNEFTMFLISFTGTPVRCHLRDFSKNGTVNGREFKKLLYNLAIIIAYQMGDKEFHIAEP